MRLTTKYHPGTHSPGATDIVSSKAVRRGREGSRCRTRTDLLFFCFLARNESFLLDAIFNFLYIQETPLGRGLCACNPRNQPTCFSF